MRRRRFLQMLAGAAGWAALGSLTTPEVDSLTTTAQTKFGVAPGNSSLLVPVRRVYNLADAITAQKAGHFPLASFVPSMTYNEILAHKYDAQLQQTKTLYDQLLGAIFGFVHEPDNKKHAWLGTPAEYQAAFAYVKAFLGVRTGVAWHVTLTGWAFENNTASLWIPPKGFAYLGADCYNWFTYHSNAWRSYAQTTAAAEKYASDHSKRLIIPEFGSHPSASGNSRTQYLLDAVVHAREAGHVVACYFDENDLNSTPPAYWQLTPTEAAAFVKAAA